MATPFIITKDYNATSLETLRLLSDLRPNESITNVAVQGIQPATTPPLVVTSVGATIDSVDISTTGGQVNVTYGVRLEVFTNQRSFVMTVAVYVVEDLKVFSRVRSPDAYQTLISSMEHGDAAIGNVKFSFPAGTSFSGSQVRWALLDENGGVFSIGNAFEYSLETTSIQAAFLAKAVIHVPSNVAPSLSGYKYQLRWELTGPSFAQPVFSFESITVLGKTTTPTGPQDSVELQGDAADLSIVLPRIYSEIGVEIYNANTIVVPYKSASYQSTVDSGLYFYVRQDTTAMPAQLDPFIVTWRYRDTGGLTNRESTKLFVINPSIMDAIDDCRQRLMKAHTTLMRFDDILFSDEYILAGLRRGRDAFNAAAGYLTFFDMTNATGGIREYWLRFAEVHLLRAQYLAEGEKSFDFQGQAISLSTDKAQYYDSLANSLQQLLDNDVKPFKQNLTKKGITGGDGDLTKSRGSMSVAKVGTTGNHLMSQRRGVYY